jgi:hypothetical protein
VVLT